MKKKLKKNHIFPEIAQDYTDIEEQEYSSDEYQDDYEECSDINEPTYNEDTYEEGYDENEEYAEDYDESYNEETDDNTSSEEDYEEPDPSEKKWHIVSLVAAGIVTISILGGAFALFTARTDIIYNTFNISNQKEKQGNISILEPSWLSGTVVPGSFMAKDPSVINEAGFDGYVIMRVRIPKVRSIEMDQDKEHNNEIANICYYNAPQAKENSTDVFMIGDVVNKEPEGESVGDNGKGTYNSDKFVLLEEITSNEAYNDYYFGYKDILDHKDNNRTANLFDYIKIKEFKELHNADSEKIDFVLDVDAKLIQAIDVSSGKNFKQVEDAWKMVKDNGSAYEFIADK